MSEHTDTPPILSEEEEEAPKTVAFNDEEADTGGSSSTLGSRKASFNQLRKPTVVPFTTITSESAAEIHEESINKNEDVREYSAKEMDEIEEAQFYKEQEEFLKEKSEIVMKRLRKALPEITNKKTATLTVGVGSATQAPTAEDVPNPDATPLFQTDIPEETLERARRSNAERESKLILGENFNLGLLNVQAIINAKVVEHYQQGIELADGGDYEAAIVSFTRALNLRPQEIQCYVERAEAYLQLCDLHSAYLNYKKAYSLEPQDTLLYDKVAFVAYLEGQCLFDQRMFSDALEKFATAAHMKPGNTSYHMRAIACLAALDKSKDCLALVSRLISKRGEGCSNPELYVLRARLHLKFNNASLAFYDIQEALKIDGKLPQALKLIEDMKAKAESYRNQAVTLALELRFGEAISKISLAVDTNPMDPSLHVYRGSLHRRVNNFNEAIDDFLFAIDKSQHDETSPAHLDAQRQLLITYNDFAVYCYKRQFYDEAVTLLNKAIKGEKNEIGLYLNRGDCFFKLSNLEFALADYEQALEMDQGLWSCKCRIAIVYNELGIIAYHDRQYEVAVIKFNDAIFHNPKIGQFYIHRARCFYVLQAFQLARDDVMMALMLDPNNNEIVPFLSRLFPGRSVSEILQSSLLGDARKRLSELLAAATVHDPEKESSSTVNRTESDSLESVSSSLEYAALKKLNSDMELVMEKKKVRKEMNKLLAHRTVIKPIGPRFVHTKLTVGPSAEKEAEDPTHKPVYTWKTF